MASIARAEVSQALVDLLADGGAESFNLDLEPEYQTDKDAVKLVPCRECQRPLVVTLFFAPAKAICHECRGEGDGTKATVGQPTPGETDPAKAVSLADCLINPTFSFAVCPVHPDDPDGHPMELKSVNYNDNYGPSTLAGYNKKTGRPEYRQIAKGETVFWQCLTCKATVAYSTTAQTQFRRMNEANTQPHKHVNGWDDILGSRDEEE